MQDLTATCSNCGIGIKEVITIGGKPYGTTCASNLLLGRGETLPNNFKGDYDQHVKKQKQNQIEYAKAVEITTKYWKEFNILNKLYTKARAADNSFYMNFLSSICSQLGFGNINEPSGKYATYQDALTNWKEYNGTIPTFYHQPRKLETLSEKQLAILEKIKSI